MVIMMIYSHWATERLVVNDSVLDDMPLLQSVLESIADTLRLEGKEAIAPDEMVQMFYNGDLPPNGIKDQYRLQSISLKEIGTIIGYLSLYHGFPDDGSFYIGSLSIHKTFHNQGFGSEVIRQMGQLEALKAYPTHRVLVSVPNWGAVRFWTRHGFTRIVQVIGDLHEGKNDIAKLELAKDFS